MEDRVGESGKPVLTVRYNDDSSSSPGTQTNLALGMVTGLEDRKIQTVIAPLKNDIVTNPAKLSLRLILLDNKLKSISYIHI